MEWAEKIFFALVILGVTWALAKGAKWTFAKMVDQIPFLRRGTSNGESVGMALGKIVSLLVWLFGLLAVLQQLGFDSVITPVQGLLGNFIGYLDNIVFAAAIFFIGSMIAGIALDYCALCMQCAFRPNASIPSIRAAVLVVVIVVLCVSHRLYADMTYGMHWPLKYYRFMQWLPSWEIAN